MKRCGKNAPGRWSSLFAVLMCLCVFSMTQGVSESAPPEEYEVKALYLYNFAKFVQWPDGSFKTPEETIHLCVIGRDPFGSALDLVKDKTVRGRAFEISYLKEWENVPPECHILFVGSAAKGHFNRIMDQAREGSILTVSDLEEFVYKGGIIRLFTSKQRVRFRINLSAAQRADIQISSSLLKLAEVVEE